MLSELQGNGIGNAKVRYQTIPDLCISVCIKLAYIGDKAQCTVRGCAADDIAGSIPAGFRVNKNLMGLPVRSLRDFRIKSDTGTFRDSVILQTDGGGSSGWEHGVPLLINPAAPAVHIDKAGTHNKISLVFQMNMADLLHVKTPFHRISSIDTLCGNP